MKHYVLISTKMAGGHSMRHQKFNTNEVLGKAMHVFWQKGYKGASLQNLLDEMGIGKGSFYATFGSKRGLFLKALKHYGETKAMVRETRDILVNAPPKTAIKQVFDRVIDRALTKQRGCLFGKTGLEFWQSDPDVAKEVTRGVKRVEEAFYQVIVRGQEQAEIAGDRDARALAHFLTGIFYGLQVVASTNPDRQTLENMASTAIASLG